MKKVFTKILLMTLLVIFTSFNEQQPNILVIGDSISIGYFPYVKQYFDQKARLVHNPGNAEHTGTGLKKIKEWIGDKHWDIVQFNWGLWDLCYRHKDAKVYGNRDKVNGKITHTVDQYIENLDQIVRILKNNTNARLIFVTTSYVPEHEAGRFKNDALRYNEAAIKVMKKHEVTINDIYLQSADIHKIYGIGNDDVHYTQEGYQHLSKLIIDFLTEELEVGTND